MVTLSRQRDFRIQRAVHFLNNEPFRTLPELAHNCQISTSRLSHLFKKEVGINIKLYRLDCRLKGGATMLVLHHKPIKETAHSEGSRHCSSFVRAFHTHFGLSPACYRKEQVQRAA